MILSLLPSSCCFDEKSQLFSNLNKLKQIKVKQKNKKKKEIVKNYLEERLHRENKKKILFKDIK